jgi:DNA replication protein DnaC
LPDKGYTFDSYVGDRSLSAAQELRRYALEWPNKENLRSAFIYVWGPNGCQKTSFMSIIGREICNYSKVKFLPIKKLYDTLRDSHVKEEAREELAHWQTYDLLIIDEAMDITKATQTDWVIPFFDSFIRERIDYLQKGTIMISNVEPAKISEKFGVSLKDLVIRKSIATTYEFNDNYIANINDDVSVNYKESMGLFPRRV